MLGWLSRVVWHPVPRNHREAPDALRRRQVVTAGFVVLGGAVLGYSLRIEPGNAWFYPATLVLALVWAVGAFASGPLHLGRMSTPVPDRAVRPVVAPLLLGLGLGGVFVLGALVVRHVPFLESQVRAVTDHADQGSLVVIAVVTALNGIAEELFFRGAAYAAIPRNPVAWTTLAYTVATLVAGNVMLAFAAVLLGALVGLERRATGGILAPIITHVSWSLTMLFALPALF